MKKQQKKTKRVPKAGPQPDEAVLEEEGTQDSQLPATLFSADKPVTRPEDDRLGYSAFARQIARGIVRMAPPEGLVLGLYAPWGTGKTTVLSLVEHYIATDYSTDERPAVIRFNPWWFSSQSDLVAKFFLQLELTLRKHSLLSKESSDQLSREMADLAASVTPLTEEEVARTHATKPVAGDIPFLKEQVAKTLRASGRRILVIIDDVDRLATASEIRQVFQAVKAVADFPNVVYLFALDKEAVAAALDPERRTPGFGAAYLEKIIQVPFEMPVPEPDDVHRLLFGRLDNALTGTPEGLFSPGYWTDVFYKGIRHLIRSPRDAVRLANAVQLTYATVVGEVNPVDFIAIEAIRVLVPNVYDTIRSNQEMFAGHTDRGTGQDDLRRFHEGWLAAKVPEGDREVLKELLMELFPKLEYAWNNTGHGAGWEPNWRRSLRVCSSSLFPTYFRLSVPHGLASRAEVQGLLALSSDPEAMRGMLLELYRQPYPAGSSSPARKVLERLLDHVDRDIALAQIPALLQALYDVGDEMVAREPKQRGGWHFGVEIDIGRLFFALMRRIKDEPERFDLLRRIFAGGTAVELIINEIAGLGQQHGRIGGRLDEPEERRIVSEAHLDELEQVGLARIRKLAEDGKLPSTKNLISLLYRWKDWAGVEEPLRWVSDLVSSDEGLLAFLEKALSERESSTLGSYATRIRPSLDPEAFKDFLSPDSVIGRVKSLAERSDLPERQSIAAKQYVVEFNLRENGGNPDFAYDFGE